MNDRIGQVKTNREANSRIQKRIHSRVFEGVSDSSGRRIRGVYKRDGNFWVRLRDPETGRERWAKPPDQTVSGARKFANECRAAVGAERVRAVSMALSAASTRARDEWPKVDELFHAYRAAASAERMRNHKPNAKTEAGNISMMRQIAESSGHSLTRLSIDALPELAQNWAQRELDAGRKRVTVGTMLRCSAALFSRWARLHYRRHGFRIPPDVVDAWPRVSPDPQRYELPAKELRDATLAAGAEMVASRMAIGEDKELPKVVAEGLPLAFILCYHYAMSAADAARARFDWMQVQQSKDGPLDVMIYERHKTHRRADPPVEMEIAAALRTWPGRNGRAFVLPGTETDRYDLVTRHLSAWMRRLGWETGKCAHELRKLRCSFWATKKGIGSAARWIGDSEATAAAYYRDLIPEEMESPYA